MSIFQISAIGIVCVILTLVIKRDNPPIAFICASAGAIIISLAVLPLLADLIDYFEELNSSLDLTKLGAIIKALAIAYTASFSGSICRDFGQSGIAEKIELFAKISIMLISLPILKELISSIVIVLGG